MKLFLPFIFFACMAFSSCNKKSTPAPPVKKASTTTVTINGTAYPTTVIGTQTWTSVDYRDPNAMVVPVSSLNDTAFLYTYTQLRNVTPPDGWRLPSAADFLVLTTFLGGTTDSKGYGTVTGSAAQMLTSTNWPNIAGNNSTKFSANYVGAYYSAIPGYNFAGVGYWTSTPDGVKQLDFFINISNSTGSWVQTGAIASDLKSDGFCIRFVKSN